MLRATALTDRVFTSIDLSGLVLHPPALLTNQCFAQWLIRRLAPLVRFGRSHLVLKRVQLLWVNGSDRLRECVILCVALRPNASGLGKRNSLARGLAVLAKGISTIFRVAQTLLLLWSHVEKLSRLIPLGVVRKRP